MKPLRADAIRGVWGTVLLPITGDDGIDLGRLDAEVDALIEAGVAGLYTNGTAGEFHTQSEAEFDAVSARVAARCEAAGMPFQIGASEMSPQRSLERVRRARALAPSAIQVILPDWVSPTLDEATVFLERIAAAADPIGLVLYNPPHAKKVLDPAALATLARRVPAIVGVKVLDGGPSWYGALRAALASLPRGLSVFVPGHHSATGALAGAHGSYSNVACLSPRGSVRWWAMTAQDPVRALDIERRLIDFFAAHISPLGAQGYSNPALDKTLAALGGWADIGLRLRWPYRAVPIELVDSLRPLIRAAVPELFT